MSCCAVFGAVFLVSLLPTFVTRQIIYGSPFATGYPGITHVALDLSRRSGKFYFPPTTECGVGRRFLFLAVVGLFFLIRRNALLGTGSILTFLAYYYFIASYPDWDGLSSYGNRFFISLTPIFILGLAALLERFSHAVAKTSRAAVAASASHRAVHGMECRIHFSVGHAHGSRARENFVARDGAQPICRSALADDA